jgi:hypothetical protein
MSKDPKGINELDPLASAVTYNDEYLISRSNVLQRVLARDLPNPWSSGIDLVAPLTTDFGTWVNQAGSVIAQLDDGVRLSHDESNTTATSVSMRVRSLPGSWDVQIAAAKGYTFKENFNAGLVLRESGTGKLMVCCFGNPSTGGVQVGHYGSPTTAGTVNYASSQQAQEPFGFFRAKLNGSNIEFYYSLDGVGWTQFGPAIALTANFTTAPDQWGIFIDTYNSVTPNLDIAVDVLHWSE